MGTAPSIFCPNCGEFVDSEDFSLVTGWCTDCTPSQTNNDYEQWLAKHADHIEYFILQGFSPTNAIKLVRAEINPTCIVCGEHMPHSRSTAVFCRRHSECRRHSRRYVYLYTERGLSKTAALALVLKDLNGE